MNRKNRKVVGRRGEQVAISFLKEKGYRILDKNFHCKLGELDIVAQEGNQIVFVEVKTRQNLDFGLPQESLNYFKKKRLTRLALFYLASHYLKDVPCRFDVVAVVFKEGNPKSIRLIKNAFEATF